MGKLIENCEFAFKCPMLWKSLDATKDENIRFCGECKRNVFFCANGEELREHAGRGECVALDRLEGLVIGQPGELYN